VLATLDADWGFVMLEVVWASASAFGLIELVRRRRTAAATH
jgi:hypothetical protein